MANLGIHSGKFGVVYAPSGVHSTTRDWNISEKSDVRPFVASNTSGGTGRVKGNKDWSGSFRGYGGDPIVLPGDSITFTGFTAPDSDVGGTTGAEYTGYAMIESVETQINYKSADPISHSVQFQGNGSLSQGTSATIEDDSTVIAPSPIGQTCKYMTLADSLDDASFIDIINVVSATLRVSCALQPYVNSSSAGLVMRKAGNIDWTLSLSVENNDLGLTAMVLNSLYELFIPTDEVGGGWDLQWGIFHGFTNLEVNRESGSIITATLEFSMAGFDVDGGNIGNIDSPSTSAWWPFDF